MLRQANDTPREGSDPIDAVVTWVNGNTVDHHRKRHQYMAEARRPLHENAINPHRWVCSDEILYCLQSIGNNAPWTRKIWVVVEDEIPDLSSLSYELRAKISFAFHQDIFTGFREVLPTFNSLAIESMIWRIEGLSERFMYFNDDVFLTEPLVQTDVFHGLSPVLRGKWVDYSELPRSRKLRRDPAKYNHFMQINAARIMGFDATNLFAAAHVVHPLRRSKMARLFDEYPGAFLNNIQHRFRDLSQFLPQGLHNHACIADQDAVLNFSDDHLHIGSGQGNGSSPAETSTLLRSAINSNTKFLCVNDLPQLEELIPEARDWLSRAIGGFPGPASQ